MPLSDVYKPPIRRALIQQVMVGIVCLLLLDGGRTSKLCAIVMLAFWTGVGLIMLRRPNQPTEADQVLIRFAFVPLFAVSLVIAQWL